MKSITEFASHTLLKGLESHKALTAEGKTPEELQTALGTSFKYEGDKLKYFLAALEVAGQNLENLSRVLVVSLAEGETAPAKAVKVEEMHFVPEFRLAPKPVVSQKAEARGGGRSNKPTGPKSSPWGLSPEEKAAKKSKSAAAQSAKSKES
jgi:hypothetical protein